MPINLALRFVEMAIDALPTKGFEIGYGDYNNNGVPDVVLRILLKKGRPLIFGPIDVPAANVGKLFADLTSMFDPKD